MTRNEAADGSDVAPADLFADYAETSSPVARERLTLHYEGFARALGRRYARGGGSRDDLEQVAMVGLLKALDRFDPERGVPFEGFAAPTIIGEIKRHFRDSSWAVRVPRSLQETRLHVRDAIETLQQELGRSPTVAQVARHVDVDEDTVLEAMEAAAAYAPDSLGGETFDDGGGPVADRNMGTAVLERGFDAVELKLVVESLLSDLPARERKIFELRFGGNMSQSDIAERVGISQMHVSRLLTRMVTELRRRLTPGP